MISPFLPPSPPQSLSLSHIISLLTHAHNRKSTLIFSVPLARGNYDMLVTNVNHLHPHWLGDITIVRWCLECGQHGLGWSKDDGNRELKRLARYYNYYDDSFIAVASNFIIIFIMFICISEQSGRSVCGIDWAVWGADCKCNVYFEC